MILLDTNVISEAMRPEPHPSVLKWLDDQVADTLYLSSVTIAELRFGVAVLPAGQRRQRLSDALNGLLPLFKNRILSFDNEAARHYADLAVKARSAGRGFPVPDGYIAAIAAIAVSRGYAVATRDRSAFDAAGAPVIDPWTLGN